MTGTTRFPLVLGFVLLACAAGCGQNPPSPKAAVEKDLGPLPEGWQTCTFDGCTVDMPGEAKEAQLKATGPLGEFTVHVRWVPPQEKGKLTYEVKWYDVGEQELAKADVSKRLQAFKDVNFPQGRMVNFKEKPFSLRGLHGKDYETFVPDDQFVAHMRILAAPYGGKTRILCLRIRGDGSPFTIAPEDQRRFFDSLRVP